MIELDRLWVLHRQSMLNVQSTKLCLRRKCKTCQYPMGYSQPDTNVVLSLLISDRWRHPKVFFAPSLPSKWKENYSFFFFDGYMFDVALFSVCVFQDKRWGCFFPDREEETSMSFVFLMMVIFVSFHCFQHSTKTREKQ